MEPRTRTTVEYEIAQERMYELREKKDALRAVIKTADDHLKDTIEQCRALLRRFPTLSLMRRPVYTSPEAAE